MTGEWMSLSEVSEFLGMHPSTVRVWADQGRLPVHRTQGGHRRFNKSEIDLWMQSQRLNEPGREADMIVQNALGRTRFKVSEGQLEAESWYQKLNQEARDQYRRSGRALLQGMSYYLSSDSRSGEAEARATGFEYASIGRRFGLSAAEAVKAYLFFRNMLVDSMLAVYEASAIHSPYAWSDMMRKMNRFTDYVLMALLEIYSQYQETGR